MEIHSLGVLLNAIAISQHTAGLALNYSEREPIGGSETSNVTWSQACGQKINPKTGAVWQIRYSAENHSINKLSESGTLVWSSWSIPTSGQMMLSEADATKHLSNTLI